MRKTPLAIVLGALFVSSTAFAAADFTVVDANADGFVTAEEAAVGAPEITADSFKAADANGDGALTAEEYAVATAE